VNDDHDRRLILALGMHDPRVQLRIGAFNGNVDPFAVTGGRLQRFHRAVGIGWDRFHRFLRADDKREHEHESKSERFHSFSFAHPLSQYTGRGQG